MKQKDEEDISVSILYLVSYMMSLWITKTNEYQWNDTKKESRSTRNTTCINATFSTIPHGLVWDWTRSSAVRIRQLTVRTSVKIGLSLDRLKSEGVREKWLKSTFGSNGKKVTECRKTHKWEIINVLFTEFVTRQDVSYLK
jgi:hypothetical protein